MNIDSPMDEMGPYSQTNPDPRGSKRSKAFQKKTGATSFFRAQCYLRGGTRKVGKQERNRRKNEGERAGKKT